MVTPTGFRAGIYGVGKAARPVSGEVRHIIQQFVNAGRGTSFIRKQLRAANIKVSNVGVSGVVKETREIQRSGAKFVTGKARPRAVRVGIQFGKRFHYSGIAHLYYEDEEGFDRPLEDVDVTWEDDRHLTGEEIRERIQQVGELVAEHGGTGKSKLGYQENVYVHHVTIRTTLEGRA